MAVLDIEPDKPIRVEGNLDANEIRRALGIMSARVDAQVRNLKIIAAALKINLIEDPAPATKEIAKSAGVVKTNVGLAISVSAFPKKATARSGWIVLQKDNGKLHKARLRAIVKGSYFQGLRMKPPPVINDGVNINEVTPYDGGNLTSSSTITAWSGSTLAATRDNVWTVAGETGSINRTTTMLFYLHIYLESWLSAVRTGADRPTGA